MRSNNNCSFLVFFFLLLFMILDSVDVAVPSYCQRRCGGIDIPYPFGIGVGCYLEKWYEIECNTSISGKFVPYLSYYRKELVNISLPMRIKYIEDPLPYGSVRIKNPITSKGCSSYEEESRSLLNLTGSPFYVGYSNTLIGLGCDNTVSLTNVKPNMVGCKSSCSITNVQTLTKEDYLTSIDCNTKTLMAGEYITNGRCSNTKLLNETSCDGIRCCKASMPGGVQQVVGVKIDDTNMTTRGCKVAFLTAQSYALFNESSPQQIHAIGSSIVELGWFIRTSNKSFIESLGCKNITKYREELRINDDYETSCLCDYNDNLSYASCTCARGYRGSPYLPYGCKDINECLEGTDLKCEIGWTCVNLQGSYDCVHTDRRPLIVGLCVGFGSLILIGGIYWLYKFIRKQRNIKQKKKFFKRNGGLLLQQQLISTKGNVEKTKVFNSRELEKATENFSLNRILGQGGHGTVYKGMLSDGRIVAVKKSKVVDEDQLEEFINEVVILSQINHRNIVKLLGCCLETDVPVLVYEFISNGNLFEHLHDEFDDYMMTTWEVRLRIAIDIAGALSYLHSAASSPIYHRDIKSTNIMLDEKYRAKVSDFGTSRSVTVDHTHLTTVVSGTMGYMDPEYFQSSQFTDKSDVYSFGVVLAELITAEKSICYLRSQETRTLATFFILAMKENKLFDIIDTRIRDGCNLEQVIAVAQIARKCLSLKGKKRPNMREVCMGLERIRSSSEDVQPLGSVSENEDEENDKGTLEVNMRLESTKNVVFTAPTSHHNIAVQVLHFGLPGLDGIVCETPLVGWLSINHYTPGTGNQY